MPPPSRPTLVSDFRVRPLCPNSVSDLCVLCYLCVLLLTVSLVSCVPLRYSPPMGATVNVNGRVCDQEHAVIPVFDHGFLYGEGVYETLRTYNGRPFLFDRHMQRLRNSSRMLQLPVPISDAEMDARCRETMKAAGLGDGPQNEAYIRILLTRGVGELSYDPTGCPMPSIVIIVKPRIDPPAHVYEQGVKLALVDIVRNHPGSVNPLIKS